MNRVLEGYKAIAVLLGEVWRRDVSVDVAKRCAYSQHDPAPVWVHRRRVFADDDKLRAWAERQPIWRSQLDA